MAAALAGAGDDARMDPERIGAVGRGLVWWLVAREGWGEKRQAPHVPAPSRSEPRGGPQQPRRAACSGVEYADLPALPGPRRAEPAARAGAAREGATHPEPDRTRAEGATGELSAAAGREGVSHERNKIECT